MSELVIASQCCSAQLQADYFIVQTCKSTFSGTAIAKLLCKAAFGYALASHLYHAGGLQQDLRRSLARGCKQRVHAKLCAFGSTFQPQLPVCDVQVYRAMKSGVQVVAAKVFSESGSSATSSSTGRSHSSIASHVVSSDVFKQEIAILKSCHDRNIVQFVGACLQPDCTIMVMEYLEGGDLYHAIANDSTGRFSWYKR